MVLVSLLIGAQRPLLRPLPRDPGLHRLWVTVKPHQTVDGDVKEYLRFEPDRSFVSTWVELKTGKRESTRGIYRFEEVEPKAKRTVGTLIGLYADFEEARRQGTKAAEIEAARAAALPGIPITPRIWYLEKVPALTNLVVGFAPVDDVPRVRRWFERH